MYQFETFFFLLRSSIKIIPIKNRKAGTKKTKYKQKEIDKEPESCPEEIWVDLSKDICEDEGFVQTCHSMS